jgi:hypothetical protein
VISMEADKRERKKEKEKKKEKKKEKHAHRNTLVVRSRFQLVC